MSLGSVSIGTAYTFDVSSLLQNGISGGALSIRATATSNDAAVYMSKEGSSTAGPHLKFAC